MKKNITSLRIYKLCLLYSISVDFELGCPSYIRNHYVILTFAWSTLFAASKVTKIWCKFLWHAYTFFSFSKGKINLLVAYSQKVDTLCGEIISLKSFGFFISNKLKFKTH